MKKKGTNTENVYELIQKRRRGCQHQRMVRRHGIGHGHGQQRGDTGHGEHRGRAYRAPEGDTMAEYEVFDDGE